MNTVTNKEFYKNGQLRYVETVQFLSKSREYLFENRRVNQDGLSWIRVGENIKYRRDGSIEWKLTYDENGKLTNKK